jgi:hypothetical protein
MTLFLPVRIGMPLHRQSSRVEFEHKKLGTTGEHKNKCGIPGNFSTSKRVGKHSPRCSFCCRLFGTGFIQSLLALEVGTQCVLFVDASLSVERIVRVSLKKLSFVCRGWYLVQDENPYRSHPTALFQRNNLARNVSLDLSED